MEVIQVDANVAFPRKGWTRKGKMGTIFFPPNSTHVSHADRIRVAKSIYNHVAKTLGVSPRIEFRRANRPSSSGVAYGSWLIKVRCGYDRADIQNVIVHEVTHTMFPREKHSPVFYREFFKNIQKCGYDLQYSINREKGYKPRNSAKAARAAMRGR
jgi:hypothetical protein